MYPSASLLAKPVKMQRLGYYPQLSDSDPLRVGPRNQHFHMLMQVILKHIKIEEPLL